MQNNRGTKTQVMTTPNQSMKLPIDECEEWIWDTLDCTKDCGFEHIKDGNKEFLIFNTNDFFAEAKAVEKNQEDYQHGIGSSEYTLWNTQLWFGRCMLQKDITFRKI